MAEVDNVSLRITATASQAIATLKKLRAGLYDVEASTEAATKATKASDKAAASAASSVGKLVSNYKKMGFTNLSKEMGGVQQAATRIKGVTKSIKDAAKAAEYFEKNGKSGIAAYIRQLGSDPYAMEAALREEVATEKANAAERKAIALQENKERIAAFNRAKAIAAESERAYTKITQEEASKRTAAIAQEAKEQRVGAAALEKARKEVKNTADKANAFNATQQYREQALAEKNRHNATMESARVEANAEKERHNAKMEHLYAERTAEQQANNAAKETARQSAAAAKEQAKQFAAAKASLNKFGRAFETPLRKIKELAAAFKRIALYRAIRTAVRGITSAVKEGLTNLYNYSKEVGTAFTPAVDNLRKHVLLLKNAFATALRPVIEALIPVIQQVVDWLVKAADFMAQVFSVLTGKVDANGRYTKAVLSDLQDANKQAKELRNTLLGFDEINRLDGQAGSTGAINYGLMFKQAEISPEAVAAAEKIQKIWAKIKEIINAIDWDLVLKVLAGLYALKILSKIVGWLQPIVSLLGSPAGILSLVLAVVAAFALWGDKIQSFIENSAIKKVEDFFEKLKKPFGEKSAGETWLTNLQLDLTYLLQYIGHIGKIIHALFHGDVDGAIDEAKKSFKDFFDYLEKKFDNFAEWLWDNIVAPVANWGAHTTYDIYRNIYNTIIDIEIKLNEFMVWVLKKWNGLLEEVEGNLNSAIDAWNFITRSNVEPVNLHVNMKSYYDAIDELENKKLPPLKENVNVYGTWQQQKAKLNLDTSDADRKANALSQKISAIAKAVAAIFDRTDTGRNGSSYSPNQYASGGYPTMGSYFYAGEHGAEWVGDINGRTGVMNTDQMADAMYSAMSAALANSQQSGGDIYLDGEVIYRNVVNRNNNQVRSTGRAALLT